MTGSFCLVREMNGNGFSQFGRYVGNTHQGPNNGLKSGILHPCHTLLNKRLS